MEETMAMMIMLVEVVLVGGGKARSTVSFTEQKEGVMSEVT